VRHEATSDAELVRQLRRDPDAICELYDRYAGRLVRFLGGFAGTEVGWDATQETFARLLERRPRVRIAADGTIWPWLATTGRNLIRDWERRKRVDDRARRKLGISTIQATDEELDAALARLDAKRHADELRDALVALPPAQRDAVTEHIVNGVAYAVLAGRTETSEQTLRRRVSRGLQAMRQRLEGAQP
jgi:RNA polymerase sigma factor (sigma-70 family)